MLTSSTDEFQAINNHNLNKIYTYIANKQRGSWEVTKLGTEEPSSHLTASRNQKDKFLKLTRSKKCIIWLFKLLNRIPENLSPGR